MKLNKNQAWQAYQASERPQNIGFLVGQRNQSKTPKGSERSGKHTNINQKPMNINKRQA